MYKRQERRLPRGRALLVDDYAHHPRELAAVFEAVRQGWPGRRLVAAFQPHRYSRTRDLFDDFVQVLAGADLVLVTEVYAAGETALPAADGRALCRALRTDGRVEPVFIEQVEELDDALLRVLRDGDLALTLGAGSIGGVAARLAGRLEAA